MEDNYPPGGGESSKGEDPGVFLENPNSRKRARVEGEIPELEVEDRLLDYPGDQIPDWNVLFNPQRYSGRRIRKFAEALKLYGNRHDFKSITRMVNQNHTINLGGKILSVTETSRRYAMLDDLSRYMANEGYNLRYSSLLQIECQETLEEELAMEEAQADLLNRQEEQDIRTVNREKPFPKIIKLIFDVPRVRETFKELLASPDALVTKAAMMHLLSAMIEFLRKVMKDSVNVEVQSRCLENSSMLLPNVSFKSILIALSLNGLSDEFIEALAEQKLQLNSKGFDRSKIKNTNNPESKK